MGVDYPIGFADAPAPVQFAYLSEQRSSEIVADILDELGASEKEIEEAGQDLTKEQKAQILMQLRDYHDAINDGELAEE